MLYTLALLWGAPWTLSVDISKGEYPYWISTKYATHEECFRALVIVMLSGKARAAICERDFNQT